MAWPRYNRLRKATDDILVGVQSSEPGTKPDDDALKGMKAGKWVKLPPLVLSEVVPKLNKIW
jgi:hypothetical protein